MKRSKSNRSQDKYTYTVGGLAEDPTSGQQLGARKKTSQFHLESTSTALALSGGDNIRKESFLLVRINSPLSPLTGWKNKFCRLENGKLMFFTPKEVEKYGSYDAVEEFSLNLVDIRGVEYKRGEKKFALIFGTEKKASAWSLKYGSSASMIATSRAMVANSHMSSMSITSTKTEESESSKNSTYKETKVNLKAEEVEEVEDWIQHLLLELKNQALFLENTATILEKNQGSSFAVESLLRQAVDLWTLAVGRINKNTASAQERLSEFLQSIPEGVKEATFWASSADAIRAEIEQRNTILKNWEKARGPMKKTLMEALNKMKDSHTSTSGESVSGFEEIQQETALFGLSRPETRNGLNEVERWKMMAERARTEDEEMTVPAPIKTINVGNKMNLGL